MTTFSKIKKQKIDDSDGGDEALKDFSDLPDNVLCNVLSRLHDMESAVRTSVLSKRWLYLWASIPDLEFKEKFDSSNFVNIVDRAFVFRDSSSIRRFDLCCDVDSEDSHIRTWICAAVRRKVERLWLELSGASIVLPYCFFTCPTLTRLSLILSSSLSIQTTVSLPALKRMTLSVKFANDNSFQNLLSGCPILDDLVLDECNWVNLPCLSIFAPMLKELCVLKSLKFSPYDSCGSQDENSDGSQDECSDCSPDGSSLGNSQVMIFGTSNLKLFYYQGALGDVYCIYNLSALESAAMSLTCRGEISKGVAYRAYKLLSGFANVKELCLGCRAIEALSAAEELLPHFPVFPNLVHLSLSESANLQWSMLLHSLLQIGPSSSLFLD